MTPTPLRIAVAGLWHLGCVTAACCAEHNHVVGLEEDAAKLDGLRQGLAPISEPGLDALLKDGIDADRLRFTSDPADACADADILWVCYDTPVNEDDVADTDYVIQRIAACLKHLRRGSIVLVSSQMTVGTCRAIEAMPDAQGLDLACIPENLRLGKALDVFRDPDRVIVGARTDPVRDTLRNLLCPWTLSPIFMGVESAEMTKHAINGFLALSVAYINEVASLCEVLGADAREVEAGLKSESRIGPKAYLSPGGAFSGGTLARDVGAMCKLGEEMDVTLDLIPGIKLSNDHHRNWELRCLTHELVCIEGQRIAVLGLTYKPGTDTLRRSAAVGLIRSLIAEGAKVTAYDPLVRSLPEELAGVELATSVADALAGADAMVLSTPWPEFRKVDWEVAIKGMNQGIILDASRFLWQSLFDIQHIRYFNVGTVIVSP